MATTVLKIRLDDDMRRRRVGLPFRIFHLTKLVEESYPSLFNKGAAPPQLEFLYVDDEGDDITLTNDEELVEMFSLFDDLKKKAVITVKIAPTSTTKQTPTPTSAPGRYMHHFPITAATPAPVVKHWGFQCDVTGQNPIIGPRYHLKGRNYDICSSVWDKLTPTEQKNYVRVDKAFHSGFRRRQRQAHPKWRRNRRIRRVLGIKNGELVDVNFAKFVADETCPDASVWTAGESFVKTWKLIGRWEAGCHLVLVGGNPLGSVAPRLEIAANTEGVEKTVSVAMRAPATGGRYKSFWRLCDTKGNRFGPRIWADIVVVVGENDPAPAAEEKKKEKTAAGDGEEGDLERRAKEMAAAHFKTFVGRFLGDIGVDPEAVGKIVPQLQEDDGSATPTEATVEKKTAKDVAPKNTGTFLADETIPDGSVWPAGSTFVKTWKVKGRWDDGSELQFVKGEDFGAPARTIPLPSNVDGGEVTISVPDLTVPAAAGRYRSFWRLVSVRRADGDDKDKEDSKEKDDDKLRYEPFGHNLWVDLVAIDGNQSATKVATAAAVPPQMDDVEEEVAAAEKPLFPLPPADDTEVVVAGVASDEKEEEKTESHETDEAVLDAVGQASLDCLVAMGFEDMDACTKALLDNNGNVAQAVQQLLRSNEC